MNPNQVIISELLRNKSLKYGLEALDQFNRENNTYYYVRLFQLNELNFTLTDQVSDYNRFNLILDTQDPVSFQILTKSKYTHNEVFNTPLLKNKMANVLVREIAGVF